MQMDSMVFEDLKADLKKLNMVKKCSEGVTPIMEEASPHESQASARYDSSSNVNVS